MQKKDYYINNNILYINEGVEEIPPLYFENNNIAKVIFPSTLKKIRYNAFKNNKIEELILPNNLEVIENEAFSKNKIVTVNFPLSLRSIENMAFYLNDLQTITLNENLSFLGAAVFDQNPNLEYVFLNNQLTEFYPSVFPKQAIIVKNGLKLQKEFLRMHSCSEINKAFQILEIYKCVNLNEIDGKVIDMIPLDNEIIKSIGTSYKSFKKYQKEINTTLKEIELFKIFYCFGFFTSGSEKKESIYNHIHTLLRIYSTNELKKMFDIKKLNHISKFFQEFLINNYSDKKIPNILPRYYEEEKEVNKIFAKNKKKKTLDNIEDYFLNHTYTLKENNESLNSIVDICLPFLDYNQFNIIQSLYTQAKLVDEQSHFIIAKGTTRNNYSYEWLKNSDPINFVLGYICNCCAKIDHLIGKEILIASSTSPQMANLVIYKKNIIITKVTAFLNEEKKYLLFNTISSSISYTTKATNKEKLELLNTIIIAIEQEIELLSERGIIINEARIGLNRNHLKETIKQKGLPVLVKDLLDNYPFKEYQSDANEVGIGQAVVYKKLL